MGTPRLPRHRRHPRQRTLHPKQPITIATDHNPGFDSTMFAESLSFLRRITDRDFTAYGIDANNITTMRARFAEWEHDLTD